MPDFSLSSPGESGVPGVMAADSHSRFTPRVSTATEAVVSSTSDFSHDMANHAPMSAMQAAIAATVVTVAKVKRRFGINAGWMTFPGTASGFVARSIASISKCWSSFSPSCGSFCSRVCNSSASAAVSVPSR